MLKKRITILGKSMPILVPVAIALVLVSIALAAVLLSVTQVIKQKIVEPVVPPDYGSIVAPTMDLTDVEIGTAFSKSVTDGVEVELLSAGEGMTLHLKLDNATTTLYTAYTVTITSAALDNPMGVEIVLAVAKDGTLDDSIALTVAGTYTFSEQVAGTAGAAPGVATVLVDVTLEDS